MAPEDASIVHFQEARLLDNQTWIKERAGLLEGRSPWEAWPHEFEYCSYLRGRALPFWEIGF